MYAYSASRARVCAVALVVSFGSLFADLPRQRVFDWETFAHTLNVIWAPTTYHHHTYHCCFGHYYSAYCHHAHCPDCCEYCDRDRQRRQETLFPVQVGLTIVSAVANTDFEVIKDKNPTMRLILESPVTQGVLLGGGVSLIGLGATGDKSSAGNYGAMGAGCAMAVTALTLIKTTK